MRTTTRRWVVAAWCASSVGIVAFIVWPHLRGEGRTLHLPGTTSNGHYQIETECGQCHTPFEGVRQEACTRCHAQELEEAKDSHPLTKFTDPRNAERVASLDARRCVTCHREHIPSQTDRLGVTLPRGFCRSCHSDIAVERPSHAGFPFEGCSATGCHKFHDNRALYEDFLAHHLDEPNTAANPHLPPRRPPARAVAATVPDRDGDPALVDDWLRTAHARGGVNCTKCHAPEGTWNDRPARTVCAGCHAAENAGFLAGRHGMRQAAGLSPMGPALARLPMARDAHDKTLTCTTCHGAHRFDTVLAATDACLGCHADRHSTAFPGSPHARAGVTCATCHLARQGGVPQHNQNDNLRPREKMVRTACLSCHGLAFSLRSLADETLIQNNFQGASTVTLQSFDMVKARLKQRRKK
jgi:Cytochrome c3